jgi:hypothetical protein
MFTHEPGAKGFDGALIWFSDLKDAPFEEKCLICTRSALNFISF